MHGMRTAHASPVCLRVIDYLQVEILGHNPSKATVAVRSRTLRAQDEGLIHRFQNKQALPREEKFRRNTAYLRCIRANGT